MGVRFRARATPSMRTAVLIAVAVVVGCVLVDFVRSTSWRLPPPLIRRPFRHRHSRDQRDLTDKEAVTVANVSTQTDGLFTGAAVGRRPTPPTSNSARRDRRTQDHRGRWQRPFQGGPNKVGDPVRSPATTSHWSEVLARRTVGVDLSFAANPQVANVSVSLSQSASDLPNTFSVSPRSVSAGSSVASPTSRSSTRPPSPRRGQSSPANPRRRPPGRPRSRRGHPSATRSWRSRHTP